MRAFGELPLAWRAEQERVRELAERTAKLRALRLATVDPFAKIKRAAPLKPHVRKAFTVIR